MQPTPRFADPSEEGNFMIRRDLEKNPLLGGVPEGWGGWESFVSLTKRPSALVFTSEM